MTKLRIVRSGDGYRREHIDFVDSWKEARYLLREYRMADQSGDYEAIVYRSRADD